MNKYTVVYHYHDSFESCVEYIEGPNPKAALFRFFNDPDTESRRDSTNCWVMAMFPGHL